MDTKTQLPRPYLPSHLYNSYRNSINCQFCICIQMQISQILLRSFRLTSYGQWQTIFCIRDLHHKLGIRTVSGCCSRAPPSEVTALHLPLSCPAVTDHPRMWNMPLTEPPPPFNVACPLQRQVIYFPMTMRLGLPKLSPACVAPRL